MRISIMGNKVTAQAPTPLPLPVFGEGGMDEWLRNKYQILPPQ
jgi:hypothetical protein